MGWYLIAGTVPIAIFGFAFSSDIEEGGRDLYLIGIALIVFAFVMLLAERGAKQERDESTVTLRDGIAVGFAQALALVPGVSRSGATISAGLLLGLDRAAAARFSFLLSVPAIVLSGLYELKDAVNGDTGAGVGAVLLASFFAFVSGYVAIAFLLRFLVAHTLTVFVAYRVAIGALVLALVGSGAIS